MIRTVSTIMACGSSVWLLLLVGSVAVSTVNCDMGTPCKVLCENGAEMVSCQTTLEIFNCCGPCQEATCDDPTPKQECEQGCKAGCFCRHGYVRMHDGGPCVTIDRCKNKE
uniref:TIL domain-containing protein n=1 Tax=Anopheles minimus TaxID=112268 RepID=A0A182W0R2_9DIPT